MVLIGCSGNRPTASSRTVRDWGCRKLRTVSKVAGAITSRRLPPNFENSLGQVGSRTTSRSDAELKGCSHENPSITGFGRPERKPTGDECLKTKSSASAGTSHAKPAL